METAFKKEIQNRVYKFSVDTIVLLKKTRFDMINVVMCKQLLRSSTSIGANVIEAQAASSRKDFTNFLNHALKSANESIYWLRLMCDVKSIDIHDFEILHKEVTELSKILGASILRLKGKR